MTTLELAHKHPQAFKALPEPYQNDSCLEFGIDEFGRLWAKPKFGQGHALGFWVSYYNPAVQSWSK